MGTVSVWDDEKVQMDGSNGGTTMRRYLKPLNWTLQNV